MKVTLAALMSAAAVPASATAARNIPAEPAVGHLNSVAIDQPAPEGSTAVSASDLQNIGAQLSLESNLAVTDIIASDSERSINTVTWDKTSDAVTFYVYGDPADVAARAANSLPDRTGVANSTVRTSSG